MIYELVEIHIDPVDAQAFEAAVASVADVFDAAPGGHGIRLLRSVEQAGHYRAVVEWDRVADHLEGFLKSPGFAKWKKAVGSYYAAAPVIEHFEQA